MIFRVITQLLLIQQLLTVVESFSMNSLRFPTIPSYTSRSLIVTTIKPTKRSDPLLPEKSKSKGKKLTLSLNGLHPRLTKLHLPAGRSYIPFHVIMCA